MKILFNKYKTKKFTLFSEQFFLLFLKTLFDLLCMINDNRDRMAFKSLSLETRKYQSLLKTCTLIIKGIVYFQLEFNI